MEDTQILKSTKNIRHHLSMIRVTKSEEELYQELKRLCGLFVSLGDDLIPKMGQTLDHFLDLYQDDAPYIYRMFAAALCDHMSTNKYFFALLLNVFQSLPTKKFQKKERTMEFFLQSGCSQLVILGKEKVFEQMIDSIYLSGGPEQYLITEFFQLLQEQPCFPKLVEIFLSKDGIVDEGDGMTCFSLLLIKDPEVLDRILDHVPDFTLQLYANLPETLVGLYEEVDFWREYEDRDQDELSTRVLRIKDSKVYEPEEGEDVDVKEPLRKYPTTIYNDEFMIEDPVERHLGNVTAYFGHVDHVREHLLTALTIWKRKEPTHKGLLLTFARLAIFTGDQEMIQAALELGIEFSPNLIANAIDAIYKHEDMKERKYEIFHLVNYLKRKPLLKLRRLARTLDGAEDEGWEEFAKRVRKAAKKE
jgi:hypothetical protein